MNGDKRTIGFYAARFVKKDSQRYAFPAMGRVKVAVNDEFREWSAPLRDGDFVVFIPPVAGG